MPQAASTPQTFGFPPLQPLLFWETGILFFACGILGVCFPLPALVLAGLICLVDGRIRKPAGLLFVVCCTGAGILHGQATIPTPQPDPPAWLIQTLANPKKRTVRVSGMVVSIKGLPDHRLRIVLENVRPDPSVINSSAHAVANSAEQTLPLPGMLVWTWEQPVSRPLPGQRITATLAIRPVRGFHNGESENSETYWRRQGIFFQSWSLGNRPQASITGKPTFSAALRDKLRRHVIAAVSPSKFPAAEIDVASRENYPRGWAVIPALLFGDRFYLLTPDIDRINAAGLGHSLALSGQHLAVVGLIALLFVAAIKYVRPCVFLLIPSYALAGLFTLPPAVLYLWLGNAPPSLIRAVLVLCIWCVFRCLPSCVSKRFSQKSFQPAFPDVLLCAFLCMLVADPNTLYDVGVQLSFSAVAGIGLYLSLMTHVWPTHFLPTTSLSPDRTTLFRRTTNAALRILGLTLGCSIAAQIATLPLVLDIFGRTTLWFPLNLLWLPILGFFVLPISFCGLIALSIGILDAGTFLLHLAVIPCDLLLDGLLWLQNSAGLDSLWLPRPHWTVFPGFAAISVALALLPGRRCFPAAGKRLLGAGCLLLLIGPMLYLYGQSDRRTTLTVIDVGQAQSIFLEWPGQKGRGRALVDGGGFFSTRSDSGRDVIAPLLARNHPLSLDFIALSHPDRDHLRGLLFIAKYFSFKEIHTAPLPGFDTAPNIVNSAEKEWKKPLLEELLSILAQRGIPRHTSTSGERIVLSPDLWLETLAPPPGTAPTRNNGLVLRLVHKGRGLALLPGDAEAPYIRDLLHSGVDVSADVLVLPHHGSKGSLVPALLEAVSPRVALVSTGAFNAFNHPAAAVREELAARGIPLHVTAEEGKLVVCWDEQGILRTFPGVADR